MTTASYTVVGMTCGHCVNAVTDEDAVRAAVEEAGYEVAPA
jgi:copper chaperone